MSTRGRPRKILKEPKVVPVVVDLDAGSELQLNEEELDIPSALEANQDKETVEHDETDDGDEDEDEERVRIAEFRVPGNFFDAPTNAPSTNTLPETTKPRYVRRRFNAATRNFVWSSTQGRCYICKTSLPPKSASFHIEHVVAFSTDPEKSDVRGNLLPSCAQCNLKKLDRRLEDIISMDNQGFDLMTEAAKITHLNTNARQTLLRALEIKHSAAAKKKKGDMIEAAVMEIERRVKQDVDASLSSTDSHLLALKSKNLIIEKDDVEFFEETPSIRMGAFGEVTLVKLLRPPRNAASNEPINVAIKMPRFVGEKNLVATFFNEIEILQRAQHPNIVQFLGIYLDSIEQKRFGIVMEWCSHSLATSTVLINIDPIKIVSEISDALCFLHSLSILHRDVKPANILVHKKVGLPWTQAVGKLCDMGSAKHVIVNNMENKHTFNAGTTMYRAKEVRQGICVPQTDVYALGKTMKDIRSNNNKELQEDKDLAIKWDNVIQVATRVEYRERPTMAQIHRAVSKLRDISSGALLVELYVTNNESERGGEARKAGPVDAVAVVKSGAPVVPARPEAPLPPRKPATPIADDDIVYLAATAGRREFPSGKMGMKFHRSRTCQHAGNVEVTVGEATEFKHTACKVCNKAASSASQDSELETALCKLAIK